MQKAAAEKDDSRKDHPKVKVKESAKAKSSSTPGQRTSSLLQTITSFGSSSSRMTRTSSLRSSPSSPAHVLPNSSQTDISAVASSDAMPPPPAPSPATTTPSSSLSPGVTPLTSSPSSSPGLTPPVHSSTLPIHLAMQSKSDPVLSTIAQNTPHVSVTPPHHDKALETPTEVSLQQTHIRTRPRGQSTSTIRPDNSPSGTMSRLTAAPMTRVISNPLPQPISRAPSPGAGRGRAISHIPKDGSPPNSREGSSSRGRSPLRDLAMSWSSFRHNSPPLPGSPADSRPPTAHGLQGQPPPDEEEEKKFFWHLPRSGTPRPWADDAKTTQGDASPRGASAPHHTSSLWHRRGSVPPEQQESWRRTKERVEAVVKEMADLGLDLVHDTLEVAVDVLEFAPLVGLSEAARTLLTIWDAVQLVEFNRLACLRLTERCANMLLAVKQEIKEADQYSLQARSSTPKQGSPRKEHENSLPASPGSKRAQQDLVSARLRAPLDRLQNAFRQVLDFLERLNRRPFLKRYLKRDEIQRELSGCHTALNDALSLFEISIQVRIFEQVVQAERQRQEDTSRLFDHLLHTPPYQGTPLPPYQSPQLHSSSFVTSPVSEVGPSGASLSDSQSGPTADAPSNELNSLGLDITPLPSSARIPYEMQSFQPPPRPPLPATVPREEPLMREKLDELTAWQNEHDTLHDLADLRQMMRRALERHDDAEMIQLLQVNSADAPEAIKALQRALEDEMARERALMAEGEEDQDDSIGSTQAIADGVLGMGKARGKSTDSKEMLGENLSRRQTVDASLSRSSSTSHTASDRTLKTNSSHDTLDREFLESGIDSLLRLSVASGTTPVSLSLPSWTITRYEVDLEESVGQGFFSQVWKGHYRNRIVAVKVLASWTPKEMFLQEVHVWNELRHKNILEMVGASAVESTQADAGWGSTLAQLPWFIVSRYYERGSLVKWVKNLSSNDWNIMLADPSRGVLRMIHEIVQGMEYLHGIPVLHGDLKAANVLINDYGHCIISDFGQSELKSEAYRLSGTPLPHGTLRWQAPELMAGRGKLTPEVDIYAFAITCVELLTKGSVPWPLADDNAVRHFVLVENMRPEVPPQGQWSSHLTEIIHECWSRDPSLRPSFNRLNSMLFTLRLQFGWTGHEEVMPGEAEDEEDWIDWIDWIDREYKSPAMNSNMALPPLAPGVTEMDVPPFCSGDNSSTPRFAYEVPGTNVPLPPSLEASMSAPLPGSSGGPPPTGGTFHSAPGHVYSSGAPTVRIPTGQQSRASSLIPSSSESERWSVLPGAMTPPPDEQAIQFKNERRYRIMLQHEFHPSLSLPLWSPSPVELGAVGYHLKPSGSFVTLFNAFRPLDTSRHKTGDMPSLNGYGNVTVKHQPNEKRNAVKRKFDQFTDWLSRPKNDNDPRSISRRYSTPMRNGHKAAHLFTESTMYNYIADPDLSAPRKWFRANVNQILAIYGTEHIIQKEDLMLVIGTLDAPDYSMFVSHTHPDGQVNFEVFTGSRVGQEWGMFTKSTDLSASITNGPAYGEEASWKDFSDKVSIVKRPGDPWDTVLVARLRFAPDKEDPTRL